MRERSGMHPERDGAATQGRRKATLVTKSAIIITNIAKARRGRFVSWRAASLRGLQ